MQTANFYLQAAKQFCKWMVRERRASESPLAHLPLLKSIRKSMIGAGFHSVRTLTFPQPCYPTGWWSATMARKGVDLSDFRERGAATKQFETEYYNLDTHKAALAMPNYLKHALGE